MVPPEACCVANRGEVCVLRTGNVAAPSRNLAVLVENLIVLNENWGVLDENLGPAGRPAGRLAGRQGFKTPNFYYYSIIIYSSQHHTSQPHTLAQSNRHTGGDGGAHPERSLLWF